MVPIVVVAKGGQNWNNKFVFAVIVVAKEVTIRIMSLVVLYCGSKGGRKLHKKFCLLVIVVPEGG